jgi:hypothetical protein
MKFARPKKGKTRIADPNQAGFENIGRLFPVDSGFYQSIGRARAV